MAVLPLGRKKRKTKKIKRLFQLNSNIMALIDVPSNRLRLTSHWPEVDHRKSGAVYVLCLCVYFLGIIYLQYTTSV